MNVTDPPTPPTEPESPSAVILATVRQMVAELHRGGLAAPPVAIDSALDRDLGFDSLARFELLARLEKACGVIIAEHAFAAVETVRDILREVERVQGQADRIPAAAPSAPPAAGGAGAITIPFQARTLNEVLSWHAAATPERVHIHFFRDEGDGESLTFSDLHREARRVAAGLVRQGLSTQEPVLIMLPTGRDYFFTFFGVLLAGGVPVPIYPPGNPRQIGEHLGKHAAIAANCQARIMVTVAEAKPFVRLLQAGGSLLRTILTPAELTGGAPEFAAPAPGPDDLAFLQYTSGSTGAPKGVILTHRNLLANIRAMGRAAAVTPEDVFVSWLPLYHDMGLIGAWLGSLHFGCRLVIMPPLAFIARPERWLIAIHRYRGTLAAAPNFAYDLCTRRVEQQALSGLDLSCWRLAFNGAEAVRPETLMRFSNRFAPCGFRREAMTPVYGLAENSVGLAFPPIDRGPRIDRVHRADLMTRGVATPAGEGEADALVFASCGIPLPGHEIRIVDQAERELPERAQGRLQFRGPSATSGYYRNREKTAELFYGDWRDSGDMAYVAEGEVYITGRKKDIVIRAGRNIFPEEIEEAVGAVAAIRQGAVAVFGSPDPESGTERLVVVAETRRFTGEKAEALRRQVRDAVTPLAGAPPDEVVLVPPNAVLKTSSGKIRRSACQMLYEKGELGRQRAPWLQVLHHLAHGAGAQVRKLGRRLFEAAANLRFWLLVTILAPPAWLLLLLLPTENARWWWIRSGLRFFFRAAGLAVQVHGVEAIPASACILVANHASYLDGFLLAGFLPRPFSFVAKGELRENLFARLPLAAMGTAFVERFEREKSVAGAQELVGFSRRGRSLLFFPEGTFTRMPGLLPFHMGAFELAAMERLPVIPVAIRGTRSALRSEAWFFRPVPISLTVGEAIAPVSAGGGEKPDRWQAALGLRDRARTWLLAHCGEPDLAHERAELLLAGRKKAEP